MADALLAVHELDAFYGDFQALFGVSLKVGPGEVVAVIGSNGAGKTTLMRSITGLLANASEMISYRGQSIGAMRADRIANLGIAMVPEGRQLFPSLSVEENLVIGGQTGRPGRWSLEAVFNLFPILKERRDMPSTALSGGQQQMVAIGRALMSNPKLLLCDEISLGLSPKVIKDIYAAVPRIREGSTAMLVVEQDVGQAMAVADRVYCFMEGRVTLTGTPDSLTRAEIAAAYFGATSEGEAA